VRKESWTWGPPTLEKVRVGVLETVLQKRFMEEDLDGVRLFGTVFARWVVPLAVRTTKMWEYTDPTDPNWVSPVVVSSEELWSWLDMVLKVGNQRVIMGPKAFDKRHPPNLVSPPLSSFVLVLGCPTVS
jgi:hypothetical protein